MKGKIDFSSKVVDLVEFNKDNKKQVRQRDPRISFKTNGNVKFGVGLIRMLDGFTIIQQIQLDTELGKEMLVFTLSKTKKKKGLNLEIPTGKYTGLVRGLRSYLDYPDLYLYPVKGIDTSNNYEGDSIVVDDTEKEKGIIQMGIVVGMGKLEKKLKGGKSK